MITYNTFENAVFIQIHTMPDQQTPHNAESVSSNAPIMFEEAKRNYHNNPDMMNKYSNFDQYIQSFQSIHPSISRLAGFAFGAIKIDGENAESKITTLYDDNEENVIRKIMLLVSNPAMKKKNLIGWNLKKEILPYLFLKSLKYKLDIPEYFINIFYQKPWESQLTEISNILSFGNYIGYSLPTYLELLNVSSYDLKIRNFFHNLIDERQKAGDSFKNKFETMADKEMKSIIELATKLIV